jgi:hypothetical protein
MNRAFAGKLVLELAGAIFPSAPRRRPAPAGLIEQPFIRRLPQLIFDFADRENIFWRLRVFAGYFLHTGINHPSSECAHDDDVNKNELLDVSLTWQAFSTIELSRQNL